MARDFFWRRGASGAEAENRASRAPWSLSRSSAHGSVMNLFIARLTQKTFVILLAFALHLVASGGLAHAQDNDYRKALRLLSGKLHQRFPNLRGSVVAAKGGDLYLSLGEKDGAIKGVKLNVYRKGAPFRHPTTGVVLGMLEDQVGEAEVVEVRGKFSVARMVRLAPNAGLAPRVGDTVRMASSKIRLAILPFVNQTKEPLSMETLTRELGRQLLASGRFDVYDVDRLQVWLLESGVATDEILKDANPIRLRNQIRADMVLANEVREIQGKKIISARLLSLTTKEEIFKAVSIADELPFEQRPPQEQELRRGEPGEGAPLANPSFVPSRQGGFASGDDVRRHAFSGVALRGVSVADVDGDGKKEVVVITVNEVIVYRFERGEMREVARFNEGPANDFRWIDVADMNGDGAPEIYLAAYRSDELFSMVLQLKDGKFVSLRRNDRTFYRLLRVRRAPQGAKIPDSEAYLLLGQREGLDKPFEGPIHRYRWSGGKLAAVAPYPLPPGLTILGFGLWDIDKDGSLDVIEVGKDNRLRIRSRQGDDEIYVSSETYGVPVYQFAFHADIENSEDFQLSEANIPILSRVLVEDVDRDGVDEVLVIRNEHAVALVPGLGVSGGQIASLVWDGGGLYETWRSRKLALGVVDFALGDVDDDGLEELVAAAADADAITGPKSQIFFYKIRK